MSEFAKLARWGVLFAALIPAAAFAVACGDDDDDTPPTTAATATATVPASATAPAERTPTARPSASATAAAASPTSTARRTGNAGIDVVLAAVEARDAAKLASLAAVIDVGCTTAPGLGGPPKCAVGQADGTVVRVFPVASCEGSFVQSDQLAALFTRVVTDADPQVYAVTSAKYPTTEPYYPQGDYSVFLEKESTPVGGGTVVSVSKEGKVVNLRTGCGASAAYVYEFNKGPQVLLAPLQPGG